MNKESSATRMVAVKTPGMRINPAYISILRLSSKQSPARESSSLIQENVLLKLEIAQNGEFSPNTLLLHTKSMNYIPGPA